jgi:hypothetical protein
MFMRKVTFRFADEKSLRQFASIVIGISMELSFEQLSLTCECGEAEIELAVKGFNATVVASDDHTNRSS